MKKFLFLLVIVIAAGLTTCNDPNNSTNTYTVRFDNGAGTGGPTSVQAEYNKPLPQLTGQSIPVNGSYHFGGYYDEKDGAGTMYYKNDLSPVTDKLWDKQKNATLYAYWTSIDTVIITFHKNDETSETSTQRIEKGATVNLTVNTFEREGYDFSGWATSPTGDKVYDDEDSYSTTANADLYAKWTGKKYIVSFDNTGGTGGQTKTVDAIFGDPMPEIDAVPTSSTAGNIFTGYWDDKTDGKMYYNTDKSSASNWDKDANTTLYAHFAPLSTTPATQSVVSLVQSTTKDKASDLTYDEIKNLVKEAIELAGGLDGIVKEGDVVVLKPNLVTTYESWNTNGTPLPKTTNGVCTDWRVTQAVAEIVRGIVGDYNPSTGKGKIMVMEGSAGGNMEANFNNTDYTLTNLTAVNELIGLDAASEGITYVTGGNNTAAITEFNTQVELKNPSYTHADHTRWTQYGTYPYYDEFYKNDGKYWVNKKMYNADVLISIPALKNHWDACVSGAIKNISIGAAPPKIYGGSATNMGRNGMVNHASINLHRWIADYFTALPADFVVMDGLQGLENGPGSGNYNALVGSWKNMRCILASRDPLAIDTVETNIINWDYAIVPYLKLLADRGTVGEKPNGRTITLRGDPKDIVVLGNKKVDDVRSDFSGTMTASTYGEKLTAAQKTKPTVSISSADFSGTKLDLNLSLSTGANNTVVKIDVYVDNAYKGSFNTDTGMAGVSLDASSLGSGSHNIEVRAFTKYMFCTTATKTAVK
jgi:uncharacterized repeat protein (TIGR02543 family)